jgi:hypothetical protein
MMRQLEVIVKGEKLEKKIDAAAQEGRFILATALVEYTNPFWELDAASRF